MSKSVMCLLGFCAGVVVSLLLSSLITFAATDSTQTQASILSHHRPPRVSMPIAVGDAALKLTGSAQTPSSLHGECTKAKSRFIVGRKLKLNGIDQPVVIDCWDSEVWVDPN